MSVLYHIKYMYSILIYPQFRGALIYIGVPLNTIIIVIMHCDIACSILMLYMHETCTGMFNNKHSPTQ